jgi:peptidoglycan/LPS O-acetylase OafA/YrhL
MQLQRLQSIDFLRGIASTMVVCNHAIIYSAVQPSEEWFRFIFHVFSLGYLGVPLFFVISGFCIHLRWAKQAQKSDNVSDLRINFATFWKKRFWRLYPPYFVALCISMLLLLTAFLMGRNAALLEMYPEPKLLWMLYDFVAHITMTHGLHPIFDINGGNGAFWSLAREEYLYLLYFVFLFFRRKIGLIKTNSYVLGVSLLFPLVMSFIIPMESDWFAIISSSAFALWFQWTLGTISVEEYLGLIKLPRWTSSIFTAIFFGILAYINSYYNGLWLLGNCLWGMCFFTLVNYCVRREQQTSLNKSDKNSIIYTFFAGVGIWSYSLYLIHSPVQRVIKQLLGSIGVTSNPFIYILISCLMVFASFIIGKFFYNLVEKHFIH